MSKPLLVYQAPVATRSGYGDHSRDILKSIFEYDKFDVITIPTRWGNTPQNQINPTTDFGKKLLSTVGKQVTKQPEVHIQMTVPNEFQKKGKFSIGITAGIESTLAPKDWIDGCNRMDLIIVPSTFSKQILEGTSYDEKDKRTGQLIRTFKITTPIEVLHEGVELENGQTISVALDGFNEVPLGLNGDDADNKMISLALKMTREEEVPVVMVTKDINFRVKCDALGVRSEDYYKDKIIDINVHSKEYLWQKLDKIIIIGTQINDEINNELISQKFIFIFEK